MGTSKTNCYLTTPLLPTSDGASSTKLHVRDALACSSTPIGPIPTPEPRPNLTTRVWQSRITDSTCTHLKYRGKPVLFNCIEACNLARECTFDQHFTKIYMNVIHIIHYICLEKYLHITFFRVLNSRVFLGIVA